MLQLPTQRQESELLLLKSTLEKPRPTSPKTSRRLLQPRASVPGSLPFAPESARRTIQPSFLSTWLLVTLRSKSQAGTVKDPSRGDEKADQIVRTPPKGSRKAPIDSKSLVPPPEARRGGTYSPAPYGQYLSRSFFQSLRPAGSGFLRRSRGMLQGASSSIQTFNPPRSDRPARTSPEQA